MAAGDFCMPKLGLTMEEGTISRWLISPGQRFRRGEVIAVIETDKIANEIEAPDSGILHDIVFAAGATVPVGEVIAHWSTDDDQSPVAARAITSDKPPPPQASSTGAPPVPKAAIGERIVATPLARRLARQNGIDLSAVRGTGPGGRIKSVDVTSQLARLAVIDIAPPAKTEPSAPCSAPSKITAHPTASDGRSPHFFLTTEASVGALQALRRELATQMAGTIFTLTHFLLLAIARSFAMQPQANRGWHDDKIVMFDTIDVGLAVFTDSGMVTPVLRDIGGLSLTAIAKRTADLIDRAQNNRLTQGEERGGAISLSNAELHDITCVMPILHPAQSSSLAAGSVRGVFRPDRDDRPILNHEISLTLSCDHRILEVRSGVALLHRIKSLLEAPYSLLV